MYSLEVRWLYVSSLESFHSSYGGTGMKLRGIVFVTALVLIGHPLRGENPPEGTIIPTEELVPPSNEFDRPYAELAIPSTEFAYASAAFSSPMTLMQWSYGDGADFADPVGGSIETDRPYFTKSASVVGRDTLQLETGYTFAHDSENGRQHTFHTFPEALLRVGAFAEWLEFRVGWTWLEHDTNTNSRDQSGSSDPDVGIKIALAPQDAIMPETALLIDSNLPSTSLEISPSTKDMAVGASLIYRWELGGGYEAGGSSEFRREFGYVWPYRDYPFLQYSQSWILEKAFNDSVTGYGEWFMIVPDHVARAETQHYLDGGVLYLLTENIQLDTSAGIGLTSEATDVFAGFGFSFRR